MASLALGLAGAGIGSFFGPLGTSLGWSAGVMLGSRIGRKSHQSPQLKDLRVQTSEYGTAIPIGFGTIRIAGWLEWAADKVPHKNKQGGKGGPKVTTTTYTCSFAIGLLETSFLDRDGALVNNPIIGILRVWANGRLVMGEGSAADALPMTIYYGTEDQLPDPTIESYEGAGQVSGNRGKAYVVFTDLELAPYGDVIPNFTFEVIASGEVLLEIHDQWPVDYQFPVDGSSYSYPYILNGVEPLGPEGTFRLHRYRSGNNYGPPTDLNYAIYYDQRTYDLNGTLIAEEPQIVTEFASASFVSVLGSLNSGVAYVYYQDHTDCSAFGGGASTTTNRFAWMYNGVLTYFVPAIALCGVAIEDSFHNWQGDIQLPVEAAPVYWSGYVYAAGRTQNKVTGTAGSPDMLIRRWLAPDGAVSQLAPDDEDEFGFNADAVRTGYPDSTCIADAGDIFIGSDGYLYWLVGYSAGTGDGIRLFKLTSELELVQTWWTGSGADLPTPGSAGGSTVWAGHLASQHVISGTPTFMLHRLNADGSTTLVAQIPVPAFPGGGSNVTPVLSLGRGYAAFRGGILTLGSTGIELAQMVANVSQHVGYAADEYDVSQLTDRVRGACISQRTSGRAAIEAWQPAYQFGAVESNFAVKFVKWGGSVSTIIPDAHLGARQSGTDPVDPLRRTQTSDKDLPRTVEVVFLNKAMDYQEGMQYWEGPTRSDVRVALGMALVLTDAEGKAIAENIGVNAMVERNKYAFQLPRQYAHLEPTDVIAINEQAIRIVQKDEQGYTHIAFDGISTRIGEWIVAPVAPEVVYVPQVPPTTMATELLLLDTALARDADHEVGFNAAMAGALKGSWPGAGLYKSIDGGATYDVIAAAVDADTFGAATSVLGDFGGGNMVDELNTFTVQLKPGSGDLASTNYLGLINGANLFALGNAVTGYELAQFRTAALLTVASSGAKTYRLSGFLRGRRGTEWALAGHLGNDHFVLLPAHNIEAVVGELGAARLYKAVTAGRTLSSANAVPFTNNGIALKPYAPVLLGGGRDGAGDLKLNWTRRTRIGGAWLNNVDVPLSESIEFYQILIYTDGTYTATANTLDATTPTVDYSAAQQSADFGAPQSTIHWGVSQLGSYGLGYEARAIT